jgi:hypothetical protein
MRQTLTSCRRGLGLLLVAAVAWVFAPALEGEYVYDDELLFGPANPATDSIGGAVASTFQPLWTGFIFFICALVVKRSGSCLLLRRPLKFFLLFPASAVFWWVFEYFNRFVQNWYYTGVEDMHPGEYSFFSTLAFATVLPAVISMTELLLTVPSLSKGLAHGRPANLPTAPWLPRLY